MLGLRAPHPETVAIHGDRELHDSTALSPPIYQTSTFRAESAEDFLRTASEPQSDHFYTRYGNPNHSQVAAVIARLERAEHALIFPSGMAAMTAAILSFCKNGDHVIAQRTMYAGTHNLLQDVLGPLGIACTFVDQTSIEHFASAIQENTRVVVMESPSNPLLTITDLRAVAALCKQRSILTIADNTFATPLCQRPIDFGIDIVMHSATKYLGGHSDLSAGALATRHELAERIWPVMVKMGFAINGFDSWLLLRGMRTLPLRMERHVHNAQIIAEFLQGRSDVDAVYYPGLVTHPQHALAASQMHGFGGMLSFELGGGSSRVEPFIRSLSLITRASSLGGVESTLVHQSAMWASIMTDQQLREAGIAPTLLRLSVGIEHADDLLADLEHALGNLPK
ncbi:MAG: aminotransferase class I/II-fold pyridoxal phosphate-dependent enzyme [Candidatus Eremiobacteraeota bacterium]|nr:aminotransferase class I/II-fold pyridoxal phosphate-dependent enzyme [Candidatus Eremiobacteraeota bacterium]